MKRATPDVDKDDLRRIDPQRILLRMKDLNLNPSSASKKAGLARATLRQGLKRSRLSIRTLRALAGALECNVAYMIGKCDEVAPTDAVQSEKTAFQPPEPIWSAGFSAGRAAAIAEIDSDLIKGLMKLAAIYPGQPILIAGPTMEALKRRIEKTEVWQALDDLSEATR